MANAVYEGADALMLSAETASGDYPLESVGIMSRIIERVERDPMWPSLMGAEHAGMDEHDVDALVGAAGMAASAPSTGCLVVFTTLGGTARRMARERPLKPILVLTPNPNTARRLALVWGWSRAWAISRIRWKPSPTMRSKARSNMVWLSRGNAF